MSLHILSLVLVLISLEGCFKKIRVGDQLPPGFVFQPYSTVSDLSAYATLKIKEEKRTDSVTLLVFAKYPNRVRIEVYQILGQTLFTLVVHGSSLTVVNYKDKEAFVGEIGGSHIGNTEIEQAIGTPIQYPELSRLLLFRLMDLPHDQHHVEYVKDQLHMVNIRDSRMTAEAWLTMDPIKMTIVPNREDGGVSEKIPLRIVYQKFSYIDGIYFPTHIEMKDSRRSYQLSYERLFVDKPLEESLFILEAPPHFTMK